MDKLYTDSQIRQAANISIVDYARTQGYDCEKIGREIRVHGFGGLNVNPDNNTFYIFSREKGGAGCIAFVMETEGLNFKEAMKKLIGLGELTRVDFSHSRKTFSEKESAGEFVKPKKSDNYKRLFAYLMTERKLSTETINAFIKAGVLYEGKIPYIKDGETKYTDNAVFLCKSESGETGAIIQGLNSEKRFKKNMGDFSDFNYVKGVPDTVYLFEAPIDLMSFVQLHPEIDNAKFVAMGGLNPNIAHKYIDSGMNVVSCVDNDSHGRKFNDKLLTEKMAEVWGGESTYNSITDREPPIQFLTVDRSGRKMNLFLSKEDFNDYGKISGNSESAFVFHNRTSFQVNTECKMHNVKDFNELLISSQRLQSELDRVKTAADSISEAIRDSKNIGLRKR